MRLTDGGFLLDVNVLIALTDVEHQHHRVATTWFERHNGAEWATCGFTETGFVRFKANPKFGGYSIDEASEILRRLAKLAGHRFWPVTGGWAAMTEPFAVRVFGHQQVTDAYLLGMAVQRDGVLVTMDRGIRYIAGPEFGKHLLVLE